MTESNDRTELREAGARLAEELGLPVPAGAPGLDAFALEAGFGSLMADPALPPADRMVAVLCALAQKDRQGDIAAHIRPAVKAGLEAREIREIFVQCGLYGGLPMAAHALNTLNAQLGYPDRVLATVQKCAYSLKSAGPSATRCRTGAPGVATRQAALRLLRFRYGPSGDEPQPQAQWAFQGRKETSGHRGRIREVNRSAVVKCHIYFQQIDAVFDRHLHREEDARDLAALEADGRATMHELHGERAESGYAAPGNAASAGLYRIAILYGYGAIWHRPGLSHRRRMIVALASMAVLGLHDTLAKFAASARAMGLTPAEISAAIAQTAPYAGFPPALNALGRLADVLAEPED